MAHRFFLFKDNQILGPYAPDEMGQAGGLSPDTLVCEEAASGRRDSDWRELRDVPELAEVRALEPAFFDEALPGAGTGALERLELESIGLPSDEGEDWIRSLFDDADFRRRFGMLLPRGEDQPQELSLAKSRIAELTGEVEALQARLEEYEKLQRAQWRKVELPRILESAISLPPYRELGAAPEVLAPPIPSPGPAPAPAPAQASAPPPIALSPISPPAAEPPPLPVLTPLPARPEPIEPPSAQAPTQPRRLKISGSSSLPVAGGVAPAELPDEPVTSVAAPALPEIEIASPEPSQEVSGPLGRDFGAAEEPPKAGISAVPQAAPPVEPAPLAAAPAVEEVPLPPAARPIELQPPIPSAASAPAHEAPAPALAPAAGLEPAGGLAQDGGLSPAPVSLEPPASVQEVFPEAGSGQSIAAEPSGPVSLQAVPIPPAGTQAPLPLTAVFGSGETSRPEASLSSFPSSPIDLGGGASEPASAAPTPGLAEAGAAADVVARLAKPSPGPATAARPPRRISRVAVPLLLLLTCAAGAVFFLFFRNPKDLKTMVSMGTDQKPLGVEVPDETAPKPFSPRPADTQGQAPQPMGQLPVSPAPAPQAAQAVSPAPVATQASPAPVSPAPASSAPADAGQAAIDLVKGFPLDGDRGTVGQWLQFSFGANPGDGHKEEWSAAAADASTYLVTYQVTGISEPVNYVFEADLQRKMVLGHNTDAKHLLAGGQPAPPKKKATAKPAKKAKRRAVRRRPAALSASKPVDLLPLPTDAELMPPAEDDASFRDPTVLQQPGQ